jgi:hypothetical protein
MSGTENYFEWRRDDGQRYSDSGYGRDVGSCSPRDSDFAVEEKSASIGTELLGTAQTRPASDGRKIPITPTTPKRKVLRLDECCLQGNGDPTPLLLHVDACESVVAAVVLSVLGAFLC